MESIKHVNSESSSEENGQPFSRDKSSSEDQSFGIGRSYECTFYKRGFTNAQALGGHMNIHRKDKDKAKAKAEKSLTKSKKENYMINNTPSSYFPKISSDDKQGSYHHSSSFGAQMNYQSYFPQSNPSYPQGYNCNYASGYYGALAADQLGANLSIGIEVSEERNGKEDWLENEVDLELRLGQYP